MMKVSKQPFGKLADGTPVDLFTLTNDAGGEARITNYGGIVVSLVVPDRAGRPADVVLGFDTLPEYLRRHPHFGAQVGRYAGLIAAARFTLNGVEYRLACNDGPNHLHGGPQGFDKRLWTGQEVQNLTGVGVKLSYLSRDGEEGYPGNLAVEVTYWLTTINELVLEYRATTDRPTVLNLTHHSYFNLAGHGTGDILDHEMTLFADRYNPIDMAMLPTGDLIAPVAGTPLDFTRPTRIGARINEDHKQIRCGRGYDHNWIVNGTPGRLRPAARVRELSSGRIMDVMTTEPGVQFYAGNLMPEELFGKGGKRYTRRYGLCLEAQHFSDAPNQPNFPTTVLNPGEVYTQTTIYRFAAE